METNVDSTPVASGELEGAVALEESELPVPMAAALTKKLSSSESESESASARAATAMDSDPASHSSTLPDSVTSTTTTTAGTDAHSASLAPSHDIDPTTDTSTATTSTPTTIHHQPDLFVFDKSPTPIQQHGQQQYDRTLEFPTLNPPLSNTATPTTVAHTLPADPPPSTTVAPPSDAAVTPPNPKLLPAFLPRALDRDDNPTPTPDDPEPHLELIPVPIPIPHIVAPSSYLRPKQAPRSTVMAAPPPQHAAPSPLDKEQRHGLKAIREFLRVRTSYDVLPLSFRLIVLDTDLLIKKSLNILIQNSIVSSPLWNSHTSKFAGLLTATDYINVIQYYCQFPDEIHKLEQFRLSSLRDIEKAIGAVPIETVSVHPSQPLYEACRRMLKSRARRIPLVDVDEESCKETVVSVITQYRILKFIAVNNEQNTVYLKKTMRDLHLGTSHNIITAYMNSSVLDVVHLMVDHNISCVPIVDNHYRLLNAFEAVDIIPCIKGGVYEELDGTVGEALCKRPEDCPGIYTCGEDDRLDSIFDTIRKSRVHRLIMVDDDNKLKGIVSLSDILKYVLLDGEGDEAQWS